MKKNYGILKYLYGYYKGLLKVVHGLLQWQELFLRARRCWTTWIKISQFYEEVVQINDRDLCSYVYHDFGSKIIQKGFHSLNSDNKSVKQYNNTASAIYHVG